MKKYIVVALILMLVTVMLTSTVSAACSAWMAYSVGSPYCGGSRCGFLWIYPYNWLQTTYYKRNCPYIDEHGYSHDSWEYKSETVKLSCCE